MDKRPIGIFDSGVGGLTVLREYTKTFPNEDFIYYGDTVHLPYGDKSPQKIIEYSEKIVEFLIQKNVKLIVIACGTASALAYKHLKEKYTDIEIRDIITPVSARLSNKSVGVIATKATVKSNAWENAIKEKNENVAVTSVACPLFVPIIEEGFINSPACDIIIEEYIKNFEGRNINSLVLGCTHYPLLKDKIQRKIGSQINLIDVGEYSAKDTLKFIETNNLSNDSSHIGTREYFSSDDFEAFKANARKLNFEI